MAWTRGKAAADLSSLLGLAVARDPAGGNPGGRGCWPGEADRSDSRPGDAKDRRGCWPGASDLRSADLPLGDLRPADAIRKITRAR